MSPLEPIKRSELRSALLFQKVIGVLQKKGEENVFDLHFEDYVLTVKILNIEIVIEKGI